MRDVLRLARVGAQADPAGRTAEQLAITDPIERLELLRGPREGQAASVRHAISPGPPWTLKSTVLEALGLSEASAHGSKTHIAWYS